MSKKNRHNGEFDNDAFWIECGIDLENRTIMLDESVEDYSVGWVIRALQTMSTSNKDSVITIYLNTYGGSCYDGLALYDAILNCPAPVHIKALGKVMSMGTVVILAADKSYAYANTAFMWHSVAGGVDGDSKLFSQHTDVEEVKRIWDQIISIYGDRTSQKAAYWRRWLKYEDRYAGVDKAKELGFVDEIIE